MGLMRFLVSASAQLTDEAIRQAYLSGFDQVAWQVQVTRNGEELAFRRKVSDSAVLQIPWRVEGHGCPTLATGTLCEDFGPYHLPLELARGTLGQLRNHMAEWQAIGLRVPAKVHQMVAESLECFGRAAMGQQDRQASAESAERAIRIALDAGALLSASYTDQALAVRRRGGVKLPVLFGAELGPQEPDEDTGKQFLAAFNAAVVPLRWRDVEVSQGTYDWSVCDKQIEWCRAQGLKVCAGPLLKLDPHAVPDWLCLWEDDFDNLAAAVSEYVSAAVGRYRGKVDLWQCAARANSAELLSLCEEDLLRLAARTIELVRSSDPETAAMISFDQPWAEYMSRRELDFAPLHFADALIRAGLSFSGIMLEINLGYYPGGTLPRTLLDLCRQLDYWSILGQPLCVSIAIPSACGADPQARHPVALTPHWTPDVQRAWAARYVPFMLSKPYVQGVFWSQLHDSLDHDFPHGGLFDGQGRAKPALGTLTSIRQLHVQDKV